jgi:hypothetical protein
MVQQNNSAGLSYLESHENTRPGGGGIRIQKFCFLLNPDGMAVCVVLTYPGKQKFNVA